MIVFSRERDESITIGDNIVVTVVDIRGDKVRLGVEAPTEIPVHRREVYEAIQAYNLRAGRADAEEVDASEGGSEVPPPESHADPPSEGPDQGS